MGWKLDSIYDPKVRRRVQEALAGADSLKQDIAKAIPRKPIQQSAKPVLNKLESSALDWLQQIYPSASFHRQSWRVKIANGAWYKVDLCAFLESYDGMGRWHGWEVKELRGKNVDRGKLALKCAAFQFPEVRWHLLWRQKGGHWQEQEVLP